MAKKRELKKTIESICNDLFAECAAASLYDEKAQSESISALITSIVHLQANYINRISHLEPGMNAKTYYGDLIKCFKKDAEEIIDQINFSQ